MLTDGGTIANDALLIASGGRFLKALPGIEHALTSVRRRRRLPKRSASDWPPDGRHDRLGFGSNPKEQCAMRGGPMFELLFGIDTGCCRKQGRRDRVKLAFFNAAKEPGKRLGEKAVAGLLREMSSAAHRHPPRPQVARLFEADKSRPKAATSRPT